MNYYTIPLSLFLPYTQAGEFKWSKDLTGLILGAFFWGYMVLQIPAGQIGVKVGAKKVIAYSMFPVSILTLLSPVSARTSPYLFIVVRILIGLGEVRPHIFRKQ